MLYKMFREWQTHRWFNRYYPEIQVGRPVVPTQKFIEYVNQSSGWHIDSTTKIKIEHVHIYYTDITLTIELVNTHFHIAMPLKKFLELNQQRLT